MGIAWMVIVAVEMLSGRHRHRLLRVGLLQRRQPRAGDGGDRAHRRRRRRARQPVRARSGRRYTGEVDPMSTRASMRSRSGFDARRRGAPAARAARRRPHRSPTGEFVSLIGHSGCGKSTLLNVIAGLDPARRGEVTLDGAAVAGPGPDRAIVFQNYSLLPRLSLSTTSRVAVRSARPRASGRRPTCSPSATSRAVGLWEHRAQASARGVRRHAAAHRGGAGVRGRASASCCSTSRSARSTR